MINSKNLEEQRIDTGNKKDFGCCIFYKFMVIINKLYGNEEDIFFLHRLIILATLRIINLQMII